MPTCERLLRVDAPADTVWEWMSDAQNLFAVNMLHGEVISDESELIPGKTYIIDHNFFGLYDQRREAKVREVRKYFVAFGEYKVPSEPGKDPFPHNQSFRVVPVDETSCILVNHISGRYMFPAAGFLGLGDFLFRRYMPYLLDDDNQVIAVGSGGLDAKQVKTPKALFLWPLMAWSSRFLKKSTRRDVLARGQAARAGAPAAPAAAAATRPA